ncbi:hypothetical protein ACFLW6_04095, partial [Chloroflexota bacterium]
MITQKVAEFLVNTSDRDIPDQAIANAKQLVLDFIAVTLAGSTNSGTRIVTDYAKEHQCCPEAS